jgi:hypothetical protein
MAAEQYIAAYVAAYPADRGRVLVSHRRTGRSDILQHQLFDILRHADRFDSVPGHMKRLLTAGWEDDGSGFIESSFQGLIARGLMVSKSAFQASLFENTDISETPPPVSSVMIPTRDRIPQLRRCLGSLIETNEKHGRRPDYVVLDDSRENVQGARLDEMLRPLAVGGTRIFRAGMEEKTWFIGEITSAARGDRLTREVAAFALFGDEGYPQTYGANRNALLLASPGELLIMVDDDIECRCVIPVEQARALVLGQMKSPTPCRFFTDRRHLVDSVHVTEVDILSSNEKMLGRTIAGCLAALGPDSVLDLDRVTPESAHFFGGASRVVRVTVSGSWGDSAMDTPLHVLGMTGESRNALMRSRERYEGAKESREVFRCVPGYTISDGARFVTMNAGVDNRSILPPFLPVGRNEDGVFALMLHLCDEDARVGHIPFAVLHSPMEPRRYEQGAVPIAAPRTADIVLAIMDTFNPLPGRTGVSERLRDLGRLFVDVGSLEINDFKEYIETIWVAAASRTIVYLEDLLRQHRSTPDYWAEDVLSSIEKIADFSVHGSPAAPRELLGKQTPDQAIETCRRVMRRYGELLQWWPVIYNAARKLREDGIRFVRPV